MLHFDFFKSDHIIIMMYYYDSRVRIKNIYFVLKVVQDSTIGEVLSCNYRVGLVIYIKKRSNILGSHRPCLC